MSNPPLRLNITELAEEAGISRDRARRVLQLAGVKRDQHRMYNAEEARHALSAFVDASKATGNHLAGRGSDTPTNSNLEALAIARSEAERLRIRKMEIALAKEEGKLISREAANNAAREFALHIRNEWLGFGARVAHLLIGAKSADEIQRILDREIRATLNAAADIDRYSLGYAYSEI